MIFRLRRDSVLIINTFGNIFINFFRLRRVYSQQKKILK